VYPGFEPIRFRRSDVLRSGNRMSSGNRRPRGLGKKRTTPSDADTGELKDPDCCSVLAERRTFVAGIERGSADEAIRFAAKTQLVKASLQTADNCLGRLDKRCRPEGRVWITRVMQNGPIWQGLVAASERDLQIALCQATLSRGFKPCDGLARPVDTDQHSRRMLILWVEGGVAARPGLETSAQIVLMLVTLHNE